MGGKCKSVSQTERAPYSWQDPRPVRISNAATPIGAGCGSEGVKLGISAQQETRRRRSNVATSTRPTIQRREPAEDRTIGCARNLELIKDALFGRIWRTPPWLGQCRNAGTPASNPKFWEPVFILVVYNPAPHPVGWTLVWPPSPPLHPLHH
ncbi:hypothetical protein NEOLEDRAFT_973377 [Neolentinus lepideus HHB14362 ss-1]|uniref:Uncharacterized protein n=1 Tax=Neolentinus lepideus HHB14362 ss-1 TaxID=1314782 RepID=A0A165NA43_9AGAM|nr:hypothetical protein NEOLEDRAFT_973377 [Neolentinus lepideus HHB14362 ss-1]